MSFAVQESTAIGLLRFHLSGFRGYPPSEMGEKVFARGLQECSLSVDHATAIIQSFDERFPTLREMVETANSIRDKFLPQESQRAKWEREYGKPMPFDSSMEGACLCCGKPWAEILTTHRNAETEMWTRIKAHLKCKDFSDVSWVAVYKAKKELGYPLAPAENAVLENAS